MVHAAKINIGGDRTAQTCWGCGLFATCEPLKYIDEKVIILCGNCQDFCKQSAKILIDNQVDHLKLRDMLKLWRLNHKIIQGVNNK